MNAKIEYANPSEPFWQEYAGLWENALVRSPFKSPAYLRALAAHYQNNIAYFRCYSGDRLIGATFFRKDKNVYRMLCEVKADHHFLIICKNCTEEEKRQYFKALLETVKKERWSLVLKNKPTWAPYMELLLEEIKDSGLFWEKAAYSSCKMMEGTSPKDLADQFRQSRGLRYKANRLTKEQETVFEVFTEKEDLDKWTEDFCNMHVRRWSGSLTPSQYEKGVNRDILRFSLNAWVDDKTLVRFSIRAGEKRIASLIAVVQGDTLIYHSPAYDPDFGRYSPSKVLLLHMSQWMEANHISNLDFGEGGEEYKDRFANKELSMVRIFITHPYNFPFIARAKMKNIVRTRLRNNKVLRYVYQTKTLLFAKIAKAITYLSCEWMPVLETEVIWVTV